MECACAGGALKSERAKARVDAHMRWWSFPMTTRMCEQSARVNVPTRTSHLIFKAIFLGKDDVKSAHAHFDTIFHKMYDLENEHASLCNWQILCTLRVLTLGVASSSIPRVAHIVHFDHALCAI